MMDYWTRFSKPGVNRDPTLATAEKGKIIFEAVVRTFVNFAREFNERPIGEKGGLSSPVNHGANGVAGDRIVSNAQQG
jgi:hypothetical protein